MWRDPMDQLIQDLEERLPDQDADRCHGILPMEDFQEYLALCDTGTEEDVRHFEQHPSRRAYFERMSRPAEERKASKAAAKATPQEP